MELTLRRYFADRQSGRHGDTTHVGEITRPMGS
jgi:hypothetical protein